MSIRAKGRRRIIVGDQTYLWYVALDADSPYRMLHILSEDKRLILSCPLRIQPAYAISKGRLFQGKATNGCWNRYVLPFAIPDEISLKFVEKLILWATLDHNASPVHSSDAPV